MGVGKIVRVTRRGDCPVATRNGRGLRRRLRGLHLMQHPRMVGQVGVTHDCNSLSRGSRCRSTGSRRSFIRDQVSRVRRVLRCSIVVSGGSITTSRMSVNHRMAFGRLPSRRPRACRVINRSRSSPLGNGVSGRSPVTGNLVNRGINRRIRVRVPGNAVGIGVLRIGWTSGGSPLRGRDKRFFVASILAGMVVGFGVVAIGSCGHGRGRSRVVVGVLILLVTMLLVTTVV